MRTEIAELGEFGLIDRLTGEITPVNNTTVRGPGDDAAVMDFVGGRSDNDNGGPGGDYVLLSSDMMLEGVDFDLTYFPMRHLGYKAVTVGASDILAMNGLPTQITLSLGVSAKLSVEDLEEFYAGARRACSELGCDIAGGDTTASVNGLAIAVSVVGTVPRKRIAYRSGARENDLICITRDLGAAYLGLHLLERERRALADVANPTPQFEGYEYLLERQLRPRARKDVVDALAAEGIVPTSMIDISDGLASDLLQICRASICGARVYLDRLPIARESYALAEELHIDPVVAALNGGGDHELLFTVPLSARERVVGMGVGVEIVGHITAEGTDAALVTPDGSDIPLKAQGFKD
ncbi:MAG: thiamine-phosphate kinase [Alistipes sp.]|jgi:thiamine-monophosphate kinase|nr:thiamine-phosphate kinase [Alistipes sp.]